MDHKDVRQNAVNWTRYAASTIMRYCDSGNKQFDLTF